MNSVCIPNCIYKQEADPTYLFNVFFKLAHIKKDKVFSFQVMLFDEKIFLSKFME